MSARSLFLAGARLLGLGLLLQALLSLTTAFPFPLEAPEAGLPIPAFHRAYAIVQALLALGLIVTARRWAGQVPATATPEGELVGAGVVLIGIRLTIVSLSAIAAFVFLPPGTVPWRVYVEPLCGVLVGVVLFARPGTVTRWITRD